MDIVQDAKGIRLKYEKDVYAPACNGMKVVLENKETRIIGTAFRTEATCTMNGIGEMSVDFYVDKVEDLTKRDICPKNRNFFQEYCEYRYKIGTQNALQAKHVIFNPPATVVLWEDGTKTVVKCDPKDPFDEMKGLALCYMKKALGNTSRELNKALRNR